MNLFETYLPENLVNALGWSLLHSFWQGLLIGFLLFILFRAGRDLSPKFKYGMAATALFAIPISAVITFCLLYFPSGPDGIGIVAADTGFLMNAQVHGFTGNASFAIPFSEKLSNSFDILISFWLLGIIIFAARMTGGLILVARMRKQNVSTLGGEWLARFQILQARTGIRMGIQFLTSSKIKVPTISGILKPVILLPASLLSGLPAEQIESIIAHELAHVKRFDFLINILQILVETLFFYHPAVWIISGQVRKEREKCCDDFAVSICGKISVYAKALAGISEIQSHAPAYSLAATGSKNQIIQRVERLLNSKKMKENANHRIVAGLVILASAVIISLSAGAALSRVETQTTFGPEKDLQEPAEQISVNEVIPVVEPDLLTDLSPVIQPQDSSARTQESLDVRDNVITRMFHDKDGQDKEMKFVIKKGRIEELYVDGKRIPDAEISDYQMEIDKTLEDLATMDRELKHARQELEELDLEKLRIEEFHAQQEMAMAREQMEKAMQEARMDDEEYREQMQEMEKEMDRARYEMQNAMQEYQEGKYKLGEEEFARMMQVMERAMAVARKNMAEIHLDDDRIREIMEKSMQEIQDIDYEAIQKSIQEAMEKMKDIDYKALSEEYIESIRKQMENIDYEAIQKSIQESMNQMENIDFQEIEENIRKHLQDLETSRYYHFDKEKEELDEMIEELEKLELEKN